MNRHSRPGHIISLTSLYHYTSSVGGVLGSFLPGLEQDSRIARNKYTMSALVSVIIIFILFSAFALLTSNRTGNYLIVTLCSLILSLFSMFFWGYPVIISAIICSWYIVSDTQNIIYRQKPRGSDEVYDAKMLFIDMVKLFYKILQYLQKKDEKEKKEKKKKKRRIINIHIKYI